MTTILDLSKNNTDLKAYKYELQMEKERIRSLRGEEWQACVSRMRYLRKKIRDNMDNRGYRFKKVGVIDKKKVIESNRCGTVIVDQVRTGSLRYGKPFVRTITRALTYEEHQELLKQKRKKSI